MSKQLQSDFANNIRQGEFSEQFADIEPRRLAIYERLFHNNVNQFLQGTFPIAYSIFQGDYWDDLVKKFFVGFRCESPYFKDLPMQFLQFLQTYNLSEELKFLPELAHYEWIEMALDMSDEILPSEGFDIEGDIAQGIPFISPLVLPLTYQYPVHQIGPTFKPTEPASQPFCFIVYRAPNHKIHFTRTTVMAIQLIMILQENNQRTGSQCVEALIPEGEGVDKAQWLATGVELLNDLQKRGVILGTRL